MHKWLTTMPTDNHKREEQLQSRSLTHAVTALRTKYKRHLVVLAALYILSVLFSSQPFY